MRWSCCFLCDFDKQPKKIIWKVRRRSWRPRDPLFLWYLSSPSSTASSHPSQVSISMLRCTLLRANAPCKIFSSVHFDAVIQMASPMYPFPEPAACFPFQCPSQMKESPCVHHGFVFNRSDLAHGTSHYLERRLLDTLLWVSRKGRSSK